MTAARDVTTALRPVATGLDHPEGVAWFDGAVWCGTESGRLLRIEPSSGDVEVVAETGGFLLGLAFDGGGACYVCDRGKGRVLRVSRGGTVDTVADAVGGRRLSCPNFPAFTSDGVLWVTDSGSRWDGDDGFLFRVRPGGEPEMVTDEVRLFPNGLAFSADEQTLFVVESRLPGISTLSRSGGWAGTRQVYSLLPGTVPDGLALDVAGGLYVGCWRPDRIYRLDSGGAAAIVLDDPTGEYLTTPTNICFGGPAMRHMFIAGISGWSIQELQADIPGVALPAPPAGPGR